MTDEPAYRCIVVIDIERFGRRSNPNQAWLRRQMYEILQAAAVAAGLPWRDCACEDRGDGAVLLVPPTVSKDRVTDLFVNRLQAQLRAYAGRSQNSVQMRLRMALHAGDVTRDDHGWVGTELNTACRLVDLQPLRDALAAKPDAHLALVVSDLWFTTVVLHDPGMVDHRTYTCVPVDAKELQGRAWIHVPGLTSPPEPPTAGDARPSSPGPPPHTPAEAAVPRPADGNTISFNGGTTVGGDVFAGSKTMNQYGKDTR